MSQAFVQGESQIYTTGTTISNTYGSANTAGNLLIAQFEGAGTGTLAISDTATNVWTPLYFSSSAFSGHLEAAWYVLNCKSQASNQVSVTGAGISGADGLIIGEYSGVNTLDQISTLNSAGSGSSFTTNSITTLFNDEIIIAFFVAGGGASSVNSPFTVREQITSGGTAYAAFCDDIVISTGTYSATVNGTQPYVGFIASFYQNAALGNHNSLMLTGYGT